MEKIPIYQKIKGIFSIFNFYIKILLYLKIQNKKITTKFMQKSYKIH